MTDLTLPKAKHLCGETTIAHLYTQGRAFIVFPLRVVYRLEQRTPGNEAKTSDNQAETTANKPRPTVRILFSAPKKRFRHAVDRNHYRRLMREAYRHHQSELIAALDSCNLTMDISFVAVHNTMPTYSEIEKCVVKIIGKLTDPEKGIALTADGPQTEQPAKNNGRPSL